MEDGLDRLRAPLQALMRWIKASRLRAAIIGGVAASLRGKPRLTKDIDVVVLDATADELIESGATFGFAPRVSDATDFAQRTRVLLLRYMPGNVDVDLSLGALPFEEEVIERSTEVDVGRLLIRIATAEDLVIMKAVAGRARDFADIEGIVAVRHDLDVERIRHWVREFASVLEMPEIHERLEALLKGRRR